jgi:hypothetical protein
VQYYKDQAVKFNVMDKDSQGVQSLIVKRGDTGLLQVWLIGENKYGRLTRQQEVVIVE